MVCKALGFKSGEIYTFGATTMTGFEMLPVVAGYRTCTGGPQETNIWKCPYCGNRDPTGTAIDPTTGQPICHPASDGTTSCCADAAYDQKAVGLNGCTHAIDQGAICYETVEREETLNADMCVCLYHPLGHARSTCHSPFQPTVS